MKRLSFVFYLIFIFLQVAFADVSDSTSVKLGNRAFGLSAGNEHHHASYLSSLKYSGLGIEFWNETIKHQQIGKSDFYSLLNNRVHCSEMLSTNELSSMEVIYDVLEFNKYYDWKVTPKFHMLCGGYVGFDFGVDMMLSNTNNPVFVRADLSLLGLSLRPTLCVRSKRRLFKFSNQFNFRLAGVVFSPTYTQLYYDLTLPDYDKKEFLDFNSLSDNIHFVNKFMVEVQLRHKTLRVGMLAERSKSMVHLIDNRTTNIQGVIGFSYDYYHVRGRLNRDPKFTTVFE